MPSESRFRVPLSELDAVHVEEKDQVEGRDVTPPNPDAKSSEELARESLLRVGGAGL